MTVKQIITDVAYLLDDNRLLTAINTDNFAGHLQNEQNLLVKCVNFVNNIIATDYFPLISSKKLLTNVNTVPFSDITKSTIFDILQVKDDYGYVTPFKVTNEGVETVKGNITIKYAYLPEDVTYDSSITAYPIKINTRIFAYGVASEYLFIKGNYDDGEIWEERFKNAMKALQRTRKNVVMPKRRWK